MEQLDVATGHRDLLREITPANPVGALALGRIMFAADTNVYAYSVVQRLSRLFEVRGAR